jgi:FAD/FMN-containing dehydrogenase
MHRRTLLKYLGAAALWAASPFKALAKTMTRRVRPGEKGWPSEAEWQQLSDAVGGNLIKVQSPLAACAANPSAAAGPACSGLFEKDLRNPYLIGDDPALTQTLGWVDAWTSKPSAYAVAARNSEDMAAAVKFARRHNLRVAVRGGGHSYQGTSNAPDSLLLWTRRIDDITLHEGFVPRGCKTAPQPAVTCGAGVIWGHAYDAVTTKAGRYVQGGGCATVNVAGLVQSGGFGSFSKHYGMAAAGLLETEVVTADGRIRTVNACSEPELFFALKGGGGGSFALVTRVTLRLRELPKDFGAMVLRIDAASDDDYRRLVQRFVEFYAGSLFNPHWGEQAEFTAGNQFNVTMVCHGMTEAEIRRVWQPFLDWMAQSPKAFRHREPPLAVSVPAQHWWDPVFMNARLPGVFRVDPRAGAKPGDAWWAGDAGQVGQFMYGYESLWLPQALLAPAARERFAAALFAASRPYGLSLHFNKGLAGAPPEAVASAKDVATNPAVQTAFALAIAGGAQAPAYPGVAGHEPDEARGRRVRENIRRSMDELRKVAPDGGAYVSESNYFEPDWQRAYWGANYRRLLAAKRKYDPDGMFIVHNGVGSEEWSADGFTQR